MLQVSCSFLSQSLSPNIFSLFSTTRRTRQSCDDNVRFPRVFFWNETLNAVLYWSDLPTNIPEDCQRLRSLLICNTSSRILYRSRTKKKTRSISDLLWIPRQIYVLFRSSCRVGQGSVSLPLRPCSNNLLVWFLTRFLLVLDIKPLQSDVTPFLPSFFLFPFFPSLLSFHFEREWGRLSHFFLVTLKRFETGAKYLVFIIEDKIIGNGHDHRLWFMKMKIQYSIYTSRVYIDSSGKRVNLWRLGLSCDPANPLPLSCVSRFLTCNLCQLVWFITTSKNLVWVKLRDYEISWVWRHDDHW